MRDRKNRSEWEALVDEQNKSGLSKIKFCKEKGIAISRFYYYQKLLKSDAEQVNINASAAVTKSFAIERAIN